MRVKRLLTCLLCLLLVWVTTGINSHGLAEEDARQAVESSVPTEAENSPDNGDELKPDASELFAQGPVNQDAPGEVPDAEPPAESESGDEAPVENEPVEPEPSEPEA